MTTDTVLGSAETPTGAPAGRWRRLALGPAGDPRWVRPALFGVLALSGLLYVWNLSSLGDANTYYAAAIYSGTKSWSAFFFGSIDAGNYITVDKPPVALWVMGLSARIFGYSTWSMLLPQAVCGVAAVGVLYATVRRACVSLLGRAGSATAGLLAGLVLTLTPITVAINRDNNPDTVLVLLLVLGAWALQRAVELGRARWLLLSMVFIGLAFNTKMLQAFIVLPTFYLVYFLFGSRSWLRRVADLVAATVVLAVASGWWMVIVDSIPASSRPWIGSSEANSVWDLVMGYNGIGRIFGQGSTLSSVINGDGGGAGGGPGGGAGFGGSAGLGRMFNDIVGGQISWLLPFAAVAFLAGLVLIGRRPRTDLARAGLVLWGGWLATHFVVFSLAEGTFHPYYTTALGPGIGGVAGIGAVLMFRSPKVMAWALPLAIAVTGIWSFQLLRRTPSWHPWLAWTVLVAALGGALALLAVRLAPAARRGLAVGAAVVGLVGVLAGPAAYASSTAFGTTGGIGGTNPSAGPSTGFGGPGGGGPGGFGRMRSGGGFPGFSGFSGGRPGNGFPGGGPGGPGGTGQSGQSGQAQSGTAQGGPGGGSGGFGGGFRGGDVSAQMVKYLEKNQGGATWLVAVSSAQSAGSLILQTGRPVIAMGGFTGSDPAMTVAKLQGYIKSGKLTYVMTGGGMGGGPGGGGSGNVTSWVQQNCTAVKPSEYGDTSSTSSSLYRCTA